MIYLYINGEYIDCRDSYYKLLHMLVYKTTYITDATAQIKVGIYGEKWNIPFYKTTYIADATAQIKVGIYGEKWNIPFNVLRFLALQLINDYPTNLCVMGEVSTIHSVEDLEELLKRYKTERLFIYRSMVFSSATTTKTALR